MKHPVEAAALWHNFEREALLETLDEAWCDFIAQLDGLKAATDIRWAEHVAVTRRNAASCCVGSYW